MSRTGSGFIAPKTLRRRLDDYAEFISPQLLADIRYLARELQGSTIFHINTAAASGGVAEMLRTHVPLERSLGIDSRWLVMRGPESYFEITKKIHHGLQGSKAKLTKDELRQYVFHAYEHAPALQSILRSARRAIVILHDPQPLPLIQYIPSHLSVVFRIHPDLSTPNPAVLGALRPFVERADRLMVSDAGYRPRWFPRERTDIVFPAIDPLSKKNRPISPRTMRSILVAAGIDPERPLVSQISRIDPWKDPLGVIEAYTIAKQHVPELQLALVGINLRGKRSRGEEALYEAVERASSRDADIHLFGEKEPPAGISNDVFVNAIQSASAIVLQKSLREGFGMSLTEAMFKGAAVIGGKSVGVTHQIRHGHNGYIVDSVEACALRISELLSDDALRERFKRAAKESATRDFLMPRLIADHLRMYRMLLVRAEEFHPRIPLRDVRHTVSV